MLRLVPPAGAPLELREIFRALRTQWFSPRREDPELESFATHLQVRHAVGVSSGRAALWFILKALHRLRPERDVVAIPGYVCYSVPAAIVRAGLRIRPIDVDLQTLDVDHSQLRALPHDRLLCIMCANLFGLVSDSSRLRHIAHAKGAFLIDNAAQALGASINGRFAGTTGEVGLYSLGRGKALTTIRGGVIVTNSEEIANAIRAEVAELPSASRADGAGLLIQMLAYSLFLTPRLYWIPNSLPFLGLGRTEYSPSFKVERLPPLAKALLPQLMAKLQRVNQVRQENARIFIHALSGNASFMIPRPIANSQPTYIRFPLIAKEPSTRDRALHDLRAAGIGASPFYPGAICDIAGIAPHMACADFHQPNAEALSRRLLTLPTHSYLREQDREQMLRILTRL
jgi:perosamine synthetase